MAKYLVRVDDLSKDMNWKNYLRVIKIFNKHNIKAIFGVIPNNRDLSLKQHGSIPSTIFWDFVRKLQANGHTIALHGYDHVYVTEDSGILGINNQSEFAGLPYPIQDSKIKRGIKIFEQQNIKTNLFMAPSHSFDEITLKALSQNNIEYITDGFSLFPFKYKNVVFIPQLTATPKKRLIGVHTFCLHPNTMSEEDFKNLDRFLSKNVENVISFEYIEENKCQTKYIHKLLHPILKVMLLQIRRLKIKILK